MSKLFQRIIIAFDFQNHNQFSQILFHVTGQFLYPLKTSKNQNESNRPDVFFTKGVLKICSKFETDWFATLLKSHFGIAILLQICCIFSEHPFLRTTLDDCFYQRFSDVLKSYRKKPVVWNWFIYFTFFHRICSCIPLNCEMTKDINKIC